MLRAPVGSLGGQRSDKGRAARSAGRLVRQRASGGTRTRRNALHSTQPVSAAGEAVAWAVVLTHAADVVLTHADAQTRRDPDLSSMVEATTDALRTTETTARIQRLAACHEEGPPTRETRD